MKILTIATQKGGAGKTTTTAALAQGAASMGRKTLIIDLDPQGNLTHVTGAQGNRSGAYEVFKGKTKLTETIQHRDGMPDIVAASKNLAGIERDADITSHPAPSLILKRAMQTVEGYDLVLIDTPPALGTVLFNALTAADAVLIPVQADAFGLQGLYQLQETISQVQQYTNPSLTIAGAVLTRYSDRTNLARDLHRAIAQKCRELKIPLLSTYIREGVAIREAQAMQQSLYTYAPRSKPAKDYMQLLKELEV